MDDNLFAKIKATGQWWLDPWWEDERFYKHVPYSLAEIRESIATLKEYFPAEWVKDLFQHPRQHCIMPIFLGRGTSDLRSLVYLGKRLLSLQHAKGFARVLSRLKGDESWSANFELEMAYVFADEGITVEFPHPTTAKSVDVLAYCPDYRTQIECKYLHGEAWEEWERDVTFHILAAISDLTYRHDFDLEISLNPRISEIRVDDSRYPGVNEAIMAGIVAKIKETVIAKLEAGDFPSEFEVTGLMRGRIGPKGQGLTSSITGAEISGVAKLRRVLTNAVLEATQQLNPRCPGIVCVYTNYLPEPGLVRTVVDALTGTSDGAIRGRFLSMSALLLFPMQTIFSRVPPFLIENRFAQVSFQALSAGKLIKSACDPAIV